MIPVNEGNAVEVAKTVKGGAVCGLATVRRSPSIAKLAEAMAKVQGEIDDPTKNKKAEAGTRGSYRYADLPTVLEAVRPVLARNGLAVMQFPCELDDAPAVLTLLTHTSGEWVETVAKLRPVKFDPQSVGSALTYSRRYALLALCGVAADDDDDAAAASRPAARHPAPPPQPPAGRQDDNHALRAKIAQMCAQAKTHAEAKGVCDRIVDDSRAGLLSDADRAALRPIAREMMERCPPPAQPAAH